ncbi:MAG: SDR family NAD(P)-dependent oxidoreductase [Acidobacteria bacterium]|nr:SDR family NAD(P)-dependent oxidoreductase [Acidobacteriota bacterium]
MIGRVLVTGGAGFIGSELTTQLVEAGHEVVVLDNLSTGRWANIDGLPSDRLTLVAGDVRDRAAVTAAIRDVSTVFHLAVVNLRHALLHPREAHDVNATGTLNVLEAAREAGVPRFVHISSSEVYGTAVRPAISEEHPTMPTTVYGASKLAGEALARAHFGTYGYPVTVVRPFNSYGRRSHHEGTSGEVIPRWMRRALAGQPLVVTGDGLQTRDFTHVSDTARGIRLAAASDQTIGRTINIASGCERTLLELADAIAAACDRKRVVLEHAPPRAGDIIRQRADISMAREVLGFEPGVTFADGLRDLRLSIES